MHTQRGGNEGRGCSSLKEKVQKGGVCIHQKMRSTEIRCDKQLCDFACKTLKKTFQTFRKMR
jgi:hypothetical protein